ncbi:hypothetical protein [Arthrobacter sp. NicSoilC5]|uniref:hypothetical protein n=1 Tax=Arthrobacter sp. NicSoilC5 TaxID=2831000 RepID=UPI001CC758BA|nr:hypothetical protein [Arthrobacter sp. NicSoilC5]
MKAERRANNGGRKQNGSRRRKYNCRHSRFVVGGMDAQTANDHVLDEGLIDDDQ